jgi:D-glycero-alpha-D-manno-heptose-7-phosphate kinase
MITSRTPYRISFFGGGTDYPEWYLKYGGAVFSSTIDKYCYISSKFSIKLLETSHKIVWSYIENVQSFNDILHPVVREGLKFMNFDNNKGIEIYHSGDLPARTGIGTSSSFSVGLINVLSNLNNNHIEKHQLALKAIELEQNILNESVGSQDQIAASYGGFNKIIFNTDGNIVVNKININKETENFLLSNISIYYSGTRIGRNSSEVVLDMLIDIDSKYELLKELESYVDIGINLITNKDLPGFGKLLHESWKIKKSLGNNITNSEIDEIYNIGIKNGAYGGKILGAGGAGFIMFVIPEEKKRNTEGKTTQLC